MVVGEKTARECNAVLRADLSVFTPDLCQWVWDRDLVTPVKGMSSKADIPTMGRWVLCVRRVREVMPETAKDGDPLSESKHEWWPCFTTDAMGSSVVVASPVGRPPSMAHTLHIISAKRSVARRVWMTDAQRTRAIREREERAEREWSKPFGDAARDALPVGGIHTPGRKDGVSLPSTTQ